MKISDGYPQRISKFWFESYFCRIDDKVNDSIDIPTDIHNGINISHNHFIKIQTYLFSTNALIFYNFYIFNVLYDRIEIK